MSASVRHALECWETDLRQNPSIYGDCLSVLSHLKQPGSRVRFRINKVAFGLELGEPGCASKIFECAIEADGRYRVTNTGYQKIDPYMCVPDQDPEKTVLTARQERVIELFDRFVEME